MPSSRLEVATSAGHAAVLEPLLDAEALLARQRPVVSAYELLAGELIEPQRQPFGQAAAIDEDDRGAMAPDELEDARVNLRPDRVARVGRGG